MKGYRSALIILVALVFACGKDEPKSLSCNLTSLQFNGATPAEEWTFTYDNGRVVSFTHTKEGAPAETVTATYNSNGDVSELIVTGNPDRNKYVVTYDGSTPSHTDIFNAGGQVVDIYSYQFNGANQMNRLDFPGGYAGYEFANTLNRNYIKATSFNSAGVPTGSSTYEYDGKKFLYSGLSWITLVYFGAPLSSNNQTKQTTTHATAGPVGTFAATYQYNSNGYPTSATRPNGTYTMTYECK